MPRQAAVRAEPQLELKYLLPQSRAPFAKAWLASVVRPEREYPPALVITTYYDTPRLELLDEKIDSDYLKTKVRVRWYGPLDRRPATGPVFAECKLREGATRDKQRVVADIRPADLESLPLSARLWPALLDGLRGEVPHLPADLAPVMQMVYARHRFTDGASARVALDTDISVVAVNPARLSCPPRADSLPWAVFEYKGHGADLPARLGPVTRLGARRSAFSKYLACYEHVTRRIA
jgi:VTC domain